jgi:hypothetical protein
MLLLGVIAGCSSYATKLWHEALNRPLNPSISRGTPLIADSAGAESPPRGPDTDWAAIQRIHVGMHGSDITKLTGSYPFYAGDYAFLTTYHDGRAYEVAFRYAADGSGRIVDISFLPVTTAHVQKSRGP